MHSNLTAEEKRMLKNNVKAAKQEARKQRKDARKLNKIQKKSTKKLRKIEKKHEKIQLKSDSKAKKYVPTDSSLPDKQKPRVGDPVFLTNTSDEAILPIINKNAAKEAEKERIRSERRKEKLQQEKIKLERKRIQSGDLTMYERFDKIRFEELEAQFMKATSRDERAFYRALLNLKLQIEQEKVIGEVLL